jgi:hypothetical protein
MDGIPAHIIDAIRKAVDERTTYTEYIDGGISQELKKTLRDQHLLVVRHPKNKERYKVFVPVKYRTNRP